MKFKKKFTALVRRLNDGQFLSAAYLSYYYFYLSLYDHVNGTSFSHSQSASQSGVPVGGTGNFPVHPRLVKKYLGASGLKVNDNILDVGHGSGVVLHVAAKMGFKNLSGIEYSDATYEVSKNNVGMHAKLIHGNAIDLDLAPYDGIFFFNPFRGELAKQFFKKLAASSVRVILTVNHDSEIEPIIHSHYRLVYKYQHFLYRNFNCKIWVKDAMHGVTSSEK